MSLTDAQVQALLARMDLAQQAQERLYDRLDAMYQLQFGRAQSLGVGRLNYPSRKTIPLDAPLADFSVDLEGTGLEMWIENSSVSAKTPAAGTILGYDEPLLTFYFSRDSAPIGKSDDLHVWKTSQRSWRFASPEETPKKIFFNLSVAVPGYKLVIVTGNFWPYDRVGSAGKLIQHNANRDDLLNTAEPLLLTADGGLAIGWCQNNSTVPTSPVAGAAVDRQISIGRDIVMTGIVATTTPNFGKYTPKIQRVAETVSLYCRGNTVAPTAGTMQAFGLLARTGGVSNGWEALGAAVPIAATPTTAGIWTRLAQYTKQSHAGYWMDIAGHVNGVGGTTDFLMVVGYAK